MSEASACLDEATVLGMLEGALDEAQARAAEGHIARCEECRQLVSLLAKSSFAPAPRGPAFAPTELALASGERAGGRARRDRSPPVRPGEILAGKYQVDRVIGAGGMGIVVAATHVALGQHVAIKFLVDEACEVPGAVERFLREARAAVQIQGEHVARVIDVGTGLMPTGSAGGTGVPYMIMELLRGADLAEVLRTQGALAVDIAVDYVLQACEAIAEAHALGIVHRDLKPANLFLARRPDGSPLVKVLDFGISKQNAAPSGLTSGEVMMGSPRYMSPEQMKSTRDVDARTDMWALGAVLFELLTAKPVFEADTMAGLCAAIQTEPAPLLRSVRADVPEALEQIVARCLEKDPALRVQSVADLARALAPLAPPTALVHVERIVRLGGRAHAGGSTPPAGHAPGAPPFGVATAASFGSTSPGSRARTVGLFGGVAVLVVIGAAGLTVAARRGGGVTSPAAIGAAPPAPVAVPSASAPSAAPAPSLVPEPPPATSVPSTAAPAQPSSPPSRAPARPSPPRKPVPQASAAAQAPAGPPPPPAALPASDPPADVNRRGLLDRK